LKKLIYILNKGCTLFLKLINSLAIIKKNRRKKLLKSLKLIFQYINYNDEIILVFLPSHYQNKTLYQSLDLNNIVNKEELSENTFMTTENIKENLAIQIDLFKERKEKPLLWISILNLISVLQKEKKKKKKKIKKQKNKKKNPPKK